MDVDCERCGHRLTVDEEAVARAPVVTTCPECDAVRVVTKSGRSLAPPPRDAAPDSLGMRALADADEGRLDDLMKLAQKSEALRASRVEIEELVEVPPSVRADIRSSLPMIAAPEPEIAVVTPSVAPPAPPTFSRRFQIGALAAGAAVVAAVAIGHASVSSEALGTERVVALPKVTEVQTAIAPAAIEPASPDEQRLEPVKPEPVKAETPVEKKAEKTEKKAKPRAERADAPVKTAAAATSPDLMRAMQDAVKKGR